MAGDTQAAGVQQLNAVGTHRSLRLKTILGLLLGVTDVLMLVLAFALGHWVRGNLPFLHWIPPEQPPFNVYLPTLTLQITVIVGIFYFSRMYHQPRAISRFDQARNVFVGVTMGAFMAISIQELIFRGTTFDSVDYPRSLFFYVWGLSVMLVTLGRELHRALRRWLRQRKIERDNLIIVGMGRVARDIARKLVNTPELGYNVVGVVNVSPKRNGRILGVPILGGYRDLPRLIDMYSVEQVIIALPDAQRSELVELITLCQRGRVDIKVYPDMFAYMAGDLSVDHLGGTPLITVRDIALRGWKLSLKRGMDVVGAAAGLVMVSPLLLLTALLIKLESQGPVFYTQERMGLDERPFRMIKFRTMRQNAESNGPGWTVKNDPRVTKLGRIMRRTSWDELPQLINVLVGEMSLVGPRPERPVYVQQFREQIPRYQERHREKAGMTGWAQVNGLRGDTSIAERTAYDLWYVENWSLWLDIKIIIRTVFNIVLSRDANAY
ncbi:MAG: undecaprenyl-phosphate glucose phosphotransferase [Chloroflexi bacterium]|nr:undecaprenyl-phosphate glucose phosphotransferase [Chloroflexota bacterium]